MSKICVEKCMLKSLVYAKNTRAFTVRTILRDDLYNSSLVAKEATYELP